MLLVLCIAVGLVVLLDALALGCLLWKHQRRGKLRTTLAAALLAAALLPASLAIYLGWLWLGPQPRPDVIQMAQGVEYQRIVERDALGRRQTFHVVVVDLDVAQPAWVPTPVTEFEGGVLGHKTQTAYAFARDTGADVAINASFFGPADP
ncbi:MAG: hypothetical protein AAF612_10250, partial [Planctomycetota bacterium]